MTALSFINPYFLLAFIILPALWFLLRVIPPSPQTIAIPTLRFLKELDSVERSPSKTPWWLLLLRMLTLAFIILALSRPILNPQESIDGQGHLRLVLDNGWSASSTWDMQIKTAQDILFKAKQDGRELSVLMTSPLPGQQTPFHSGILNYAQAKAIIDGAQIQPWKSDYAATLDVVRQHETISSAQTYWLSTGVIEQADKQSFADVLKALGQQGDVIYYDPHNEQTSLILKDTINKQTGLKIPNGFTVERANGMKSQKRPFVVNAYSKNGTVLDSVSDSFVSGDDKTKEILFDFPQSVLPELSYLRLSYTPGAAGTLLLADRYITKTVGIASRINAQDTAPLIEDSYYLERALEPSANILKGPIVDLLSSETSMIILPDVANMPPQTLNDLTQWVENGGLLVNFAGPNLAENSTELIPVTIRKGGRALEGIMTWEEPLTIGEFPENSPFYGFDIPQDIKIRQMVLAQPSPELPDLTWASLEDGTPLITSRVHGKGRLVLIHTTATPRWSDLPISVLYVEILERLVKMAGQATNKVQQQNGTLMPQLVLDGQGRLNQPESFVKPISANKFKSFVPNSSNPPGIYGRSGYVEALNLGNRIAEFERTQSLIPSSVIQKSYDPQGETRLMPYFLTAAVSFILIDWIIMLVLSGLIAISFGHLSSKTKGQAICFLAFMMTMGWGLSCSAKAETQAQAIQYATEMHLAYIETPVERINQSAELGLEQLIRVLRMRTSVEPVGVASINLETDNLSYFPIIYWPVTRSMPDLTQSQALKVQSYLDNGGMILFDTQDQPKRISALDGIAESENAKALRRILEPVNIPALVPVPDNHVLTKSFYLLQNFSGRYDGGRVWVEQASTDPERRTGLDGVTRVIIGSHDWAGAWASTPSSRNPGFSTGSRQQEMAFRFGVNLVMYALTGNYKSDQVHVPFILERLGQ